jgi:phage shock protein C
MPVYPDKKFLGVCAWLSYKFEIDVTMLRLIFVAATILGMGSPILIYLILALVKP